MKSKILFGVYFLWQLSSYSQSQNPPDIKWNRIVTDNFKIIFPSEIEPEAQRVANTLEWVHINDTRTLSGKPEPISVVLYNRTTKSNAFAALAPRRMGWYLCPPQSVTSLGSTDWVQTLALHEYRHVVHYAKNKQHFTRFMTYLYGDIGQNMMRWSIPDWFFEGDAVAVETSFTSGGRGRMPEFLMNLRTIHLSGNRYTYDQAYLGSYKRFYPSVYHMGYPIIAYSRIQYGADIWDKVLDRTSKISFWPYAFGTSLKKYTGLNVSKMYKATYGDLNLKWQEQNSILNFTDVRIINKHKKSCWTNYYNPKYDSHGNIIAGKESLQKIAAFYLIDKDGNEKKIKNTDADIFTFGNNTAVWERSIADIRWGEQDFSDIMMLDLKNKSQNRLTKKKWYLSPSLSPDGSKIVVVEYKENQNYRLVILDAKTGNEIQSLSVGDNDYIRTPVWSDDNKTIAFTHAKYSGPALSILNTETQELKKLIHYNFENIGRPVFYNNFILYNSGFSGINNIYAVDIKSGQRYQVTSRPYGAYNADVSPDKSKIVFQDYTIDGFNIVEMDLNPDRWTKLESINKTELPYFQKLVEQEGDINIKQAEMDNKKYPVNKYNRFKDAIKIHSWGIFPSETSLEFDIYSGNYLNTLGIRAGYEYNVNEKTNTGFIGLSYARFFPVFTLVSAYGQRRETYSFQNGNYEDEWTEFNNSVSVNLPINLSRGVFHRNFSLKGTYSYVKIQNREYNPTFELPDGGFSLYWGGISFSNNMQYAWRDFNPRWGQNLAMDFKKIGENGGYKGYLLSARASLFLPGLLPQNSLKLGATYEKQAKYNADEQESLYYFSSMFQFPRGYTAYTYDDIYKLSVDYQFPLWYPDINIGPLVYFKRVRLGGFFDYGKGNWGDLTDDFQSVGGNFLVEFKLFRYDYPFEAGLQIARRLTDGQNQYSILIMGLPF